MNYISVPDILEKVINTGYKDKLIFSGKHTYVSVVLEYQKEIYSVKLDFKDNPFIQHNYNSLPSFHSYLDSIKGLDAHIFNIIPCLYTNGEKVVFISDYNLSDKYCNSEINIIEPIFSIVHQNSWEQGLSHKINSDLKRSIIHTGGYNHEDFDFINEYIKDPNYTKNWTSNKKLVELLTDGHYDTHLSECYREILVKEREGILNKILE